MENSHNLSAFRQEKIGQESSYMSKGMRYFLSLMSNPEGEIRSTQANPEERRITPLLSEVNHPVIQEEHVADGYYEDSYRQALSRPELFAHGFVPYNYPVKDFGAYLKAWYNKLRSQNYEHENAGALNSSNEKIRPTYHDRADETLQRINNVGIYNSNIIPATGERYNANILESRFQDVLYKARETLKSNFRVILPFASEAGTIGKVIKYSQNVVGEEHVLAIDSGVQEEATKEAKKTGARVVNQKEIIANVDWEKLKSLGILPSSFHLNGAKGWTLIAGYLALEATGELAKTNVIQHDTDIVQPGTQHREDPGQPGEYHALEHIAIPYTYPVQDAVINASYNLRTGQGRNNEPWTYMASRIANLSESEEMMLFGKALATIAWPLTGERSTKGSFARTFPRATGMETETQDNFCLTGLDVRSGNRQIMQVANPNPKVENRASPRDREFAIVEHCCFWGERLAQHSERVERHPHEWNLEDISSFNARYGGKLYTPDVPASDDHHGNVPVIVRFGFVIPSIEQLRQLGVVDWENIRNTVQKSN